MDTQELCIQAAHGDEHSDTGAKTRRYLRQKDELTRLSHPKADVLVSRPDARCVDDTSPHLDAILILRVAEGRDLPGGIRHEHWRRCNEDAEAVHI